MKLMLRVIGQVYVNYITEQIYKLVFYSRTIINNQPFKSENLFTANRKDGNVTGKTTKISTPNVKNTRIILNR